MTTDFLLKDELSEEEPASEGCDSPLRRVTMAEASEYLALRRAAAPSCASPPPDLFYIGAVCLLLAIVSVGCFAFVLGGVNHSAMQALLEEEDYTRRDKAKMPRHRRGHAGGKAHRKEKVTAARYIKKCPFSERTDIFCVFAYRHSAQ